MKRFLTRLPRGRFGLAWRLAMLAIVAQLVAGFVSAGNHARLLGGGAEEVCTADGLVRVAADGRAIPDGDPSPLDGSIHCAVCVLAGETPFPPHPLDPVRHPRPSAAIRPWLAAESLPPAAQALRPPPRAPPASA